MKSGDEHRLDSRFQGNDKEAKFGIKLVYQK